MNSIPSMRFTHEFAPFMRAVHDPPRRTRSAHSAQRTAHSAQRTAHSAQRTAHRVEGSRLPRARPRIPPPPRRRHRVGASAPNRELRAPPSAPSASAPSAVSLRWPRERARVDDTDARRKPSFMRPSSRVPSGRLNRLLQLGTTGARMAAGGLVEKGRRLKERAEQELPHALLTADNAKLLAERLARLRGAAMKVGQMLSMEGDSMLPKEFA